MPSIERSINVEQRCMFFCQRVCIPKGWIEAEFLKQITRHSGDIVDDARKSDSLEVSLVESTWYIRRKSNPAQHCKVIVPEPGQKIDLYGYLLYLS